MSRKEELISLKEVAEQIKNGTYVKPNTTITDEEYIQAGTFVMTSEELVNGNSK